MENIAQTLKGRLKGFMQRPLGVDAVDDVYGSGSHHFSEIALSPYLNRPGGNPDDGTGFWYIGKHNRSGAHNGIGCYVHTLDHRRSSADMGARTHMHAPAQHGSRRHMRVRVHDAIMVDPCSRVVRLGLDAFEHVLGVRPVLVRGGGTLPIVPALVANGIPTLLTGFDLPEGNAHAPNERISLELVELGEASARELFRRLAQLGSEL